MQKLARKPLKQAIEDFWKRFGAFGTPKAFRAYKRVGGAALIGTPIAYGASQVSDVHKFLTDPDPELKAALQYGPEKFHKQRFGRMPIGYDPEAVNRRYKTHLKDLIEAPYKEPGEQVVTASATDFLEKRAELQGMEKEAFRRLIQGAQKMFGIGALGRAHKLQKKIQAARAAATQIGATPELTQTLEQAALAPKKGLLEGGLIGPRGALIGLPILGAAGLAGGYLEPLLTRAGFELRETPEKYRGITGLPERVRMDELIAEDFAKAVGKELGKATVGLTGDILSKAVSIPGAIAGGMQRQNVLSELQTEDDVLAKADPTQINEAYHTMVRFAPTLATDKNAVKTFLRESILYGTGPNFTTIKQLADAEGAVNRPPAVVVKR